MSTIVPRRFLRRVPRRLWRTAALTALAAMAWAGDGFAADRTRPPNVILILMDDMGWRDVGFAGNTFVETPQIDRLAKSGLVFTQSYASDPNCAPTRACLMSGQYTPRHGIYTVVDPRQPPGSPWHKLVAAHSESELATEVVTLPESLKAAGYATGFFGMWNLGRGRTGPVTPGGQGFDTVVFPETIGFGKDEYFDDKGNYLSDRLTDEVLAFVEKHRDRPFFAYYPDHAVHAPFNPKPDLLAKYERKAKAGGDGRNDPAYAATIEAVDQNVGRIMAGLEKLRLVDDTIVIFTSDNGGTQQYTAPLSGSKGQLYEGGIGRATPSSAVREGDSKLIEFFEDGGRTELYDLRDDPNEKRDLAKSQPGRVAALSRTLHQWQQATGAAIPRDANPAYDPKADRPRGGQPGGGQRPGQKQGQGGKGSGGKPADAGKGPEKGGRKSMRQESAP